MVPNILLWYAWFSATRRESGTASSPCVCGSAESTCACADFAGALSAGYNACAQTCLSVLCWPGAWRAALPLRRAAVRPGSRAVALCLQTHAANERAVTNARRVQVSAQHHNPCGLYQEDRGAGVERPAQAGHGGCVCRHGLERRSPPRGQGAAQLETKQLLIVRCLMALLLGAISALGSPHTSALSNLMWPAALARAPSLHSLLRPHVTSGSAGDLGVLDEQQRHVRRCLQCAAGVHQGERRMQRAPVLFLPRGCPRCAPSSSRVCEVLGAVR